MLFLYGDSYFSRFKVLASYIDDGSFLIDLCCGTGDFYTFALREKNVEYLGIDYSESFVKYGLKHGIKMSAGSVSNYNYPIADYYTINDSLYQFGYGARELIEKMLISSRKKVIIMEPIKNFSNSNNKILSWFASRITRTGESNRDFRFSEKSLDDLINKYFSSNITESRIAPGGRDKIYILANR